MITLTTPPQVNTILGGSSLVAYNKAIVGPFTMDPLTQTISAALRLTSTAAPTQQPILGTVTISVPAAQVTVQVPQLDFYKQLTTSSPQNTAILGWIEAAQAQIENGLIAVGIIQGTRTSGA